MSRVSTVLRHAMVMAGRRGISLYRIAKECELDDSIVYRFYHSECGLALSSVDKLCEFLALELNRTDQEPQATFRTRTSRPKTAPRKVEPKPTKKAPKKAKKAAKKTTKKAAKKKTKKAVKKTAKKTAKKKAKRKAGKKR